MGCVYGIDHGAWLAKQLLGDHILPYLVNENTFQVLETCCSCWTGVKLLIFSAFICALLSLFRILSIDDDFLFSNFICVKHFHNQERKLKMPLLLSPSNALQTVYKHLWAFLWLYETTFAFLMKLSWIRNTNHIKMFSSEHKPQVFLLQLQPLLSANSPMQWF